MTMTRLERITSDPAICHGKPTVRGLRYPVEMLLELLASGMTIAEILEDYPDLEHDDLLGLAGPTRTYLASVSIPRSSTAKCQVTVLSTTS